MTSLREPDAHLTLLPGETWLAGGTWLFSEPQPHVTGLVDLTTLGWTPWIEDETGVEIAATCTIDELVTHAERSGRPGWAAARACAESLVMSSKVWASATVGGNVCLGLPAGAMTSLLAGLGAVATVLPAAGDPGGEHRVPVADLVTGDGRTSLRPGDVLRSFHVPAASIASPVAVRRFGLTEMGRAGGLVVGRREVGTGRLVVTITAATPHPVVLHLPAAADPTDLGDDVERAVASVPTWFDDVHGAPDWRAAQTLRCVHDVARELTRTDGPAR